ncbi:signal peptidase I [Algicola sagamiensis]|uniref:signal peptidase I n=1 Tax=Algicola sagamiensis TaxID=163869 RepID=UPI00035F5F9F|nr:signal peptidase I [Algicola sagamiensis]
MASYFAIFLVVLSLGSGLIWLLDATVFAPKRRERLVAAEAEAGGELGEDASDAILRQSAIAETAQSIFPIVLLITLFRSFLYEPFQIPSSSMLPTLLVGDFILVNKYSYGVKDPVWRKQLIDVGEPARGDIAVFKYPENEKQDFIKRVIGLPGDTIIYRNKKLFIQPSCDKNPEKCERPQQIEPEIVNSDEFEVRGIPLVRLKEDLLGEKTHDILLAPVYMMDEAKEFYRQHSSGEVGKWVVPKDSYFVLGDNRDNSRDSRFWGFVHKDLLVGEAVFIWMSFEFPENGDDSWLPGFIPRGVRFERLGPLND